jgi:hypothetical protein
VASTAIIPVVHAAATNHGHHTALVIASTTLIAVTTPNNTTSSATVVQHTAARFVADAEVMVVFRFRARQRYPWTASGARP